MNWRARAWMSSRSSGCCSGCQPSESSSSRSRPQVSSVSSVCLLAAGQDAELACELSERVGVLRDSKRFSDACCRHGVAEGQLFDEPGECERRYPDRGRDEENDIERVSERLDVGAVDSGREL